MNKSALIFLCMVAVSVPFSQPVFAEKSEAVDTAAKNSVPADAGVVAGNEADEAEKAGNAPLAEDLGRRVGEEVEADAVKAAVSAMIDEGADPCVLVEEALNAGYDPEAVISAAVGSSDRLTCIFSAALSTGRVDAKGLARICRDSEAGPEAVAAAIAAAEAGGENEYAGSSRSADSGFEAPKDIPSGGLGGGGERVSPDNLP